MRFDERPALVALSPAAVDEVIKALVEEARSDDPWISGDDLLVRIGAIALEWDDRREKVGR